MHVCWVRARPQNEPLPRPRLLIRGSNPEGGRPFGGVAQLVVHQTFSPPGPSPSHLSFLLEDSTNQVRKCVSGGFPPTPGESAIWYQIPQILYRGPAAFCPGFGAVGNRTHDPMLLTSPLRRGGVRITRPRPRRRVSRRAAAIPPQSAGCPVRHRRRSRRRARRGSGRAGTCRAVP
jgi:hypothetical protein